MTQTHIVFDCSADSPLPLPGTVERKAFFIPFADRLRSAANQGGRVLVLPLHFPKLPENLLSQLQEVLDCDPMVGFCSLGPQEWPLTHFSPFPRSPVVLCRGELLEEFLLSMKDEELADARALPRLALLANRVGYGSVSVASEYWNKETDPLLNPETCALLVDEFPGLLAALVPYRRQDMASRMSVTSGKPRVVLDYSDLPAVHNGTAEVGFRILSSLLEGKSCSLSLLVQESTAHLFQLQEKFPELDIRPPDSVGNEYDLALRMSQPFSNYTLFNLACRAPRNVFLIHDTILFDCLQIRQHQPDIGAIWSRMAEHADLLIFGSEFSRNIFHRRFPVPEDTRSTVLHWSFSPEDYLSPPPIVGSGEEHPHLVQENSEEYCAVLGNQFYAHKGIEHTLPMLIERFQDRRFYCLGLTTNPAPNILGLASGSLSWRAISRLIEGAQLVIVPTFYEGFGLPIFHAMSRGKTVLARDSQLLVELLPHWKGPGQLIRYRSSRHLEELLRAFFSARDAGKRSGFTSSGGISELEDSLRTNPFGVSRRVAPSERANELFNIWNWKAIGERLSQLLLEVASQPPRKAWKRLSPELAPTSIDELRLYDENLRICMAQREDLRSQIIRYDENLQIAIRQRDQLRRDLEN